MSELGTRLREARERQGLSLAQAAMDTRILQQSLAALEEGAFQRLPGDVVIRGFIRNYAQYLGLGSDELIELYRRERGVTDQIRVVPATNPPRTRAYVMQSILRSTPSVASATASPLRPGRWPPLPFPHPRPSRLPRLAWLQPSHPARLRRSPLLPAILRGRPSALAPPRGRPSSPAALLRPPLPAPPPPPRSCSSSLSLASVAMRTPGCVSRLMAILPLRVCCAPAKTLPSPPSAVSSCAPATRRMCLSLLMAFSKDRLALTPASPSIGPGRQTRPARFGVIRSRRLRPACNQAGLAEPGSFRTAIGVARPGRMGI
jgi:transcriptional regulator with XRE-family HTH domain